MIRRLWLLLGLLSVATAAAFATAQETGNIEPRLLGPEIWRLPPVNEFPSLTPSEGPDINFQAPAALVVPHYEMLPAPRPEEAKPTPGNAPPPSDLPIAEGPIEPPPEKVKLWSGSFNLGIDGSEGNTETFDVHFSFNAKRTTACSVITAMLDYNRQTSKTVATEDRLYFDGRYEQLCGASRWSVFYHQTIEYDQFQSFDVRDTSDIGVGYRLINQETLTAISRIGGGFSHEYGGPDDGMYVPEAVFGLQFERQLNKRQKFIGSMEYAPDVTRFSHYRLRTQAAWEVLLDEDRNLNLRLGVLNRYNNEPDDDARANDLDYALMLMWKF
ncbi:MAG: DUF481 domain-containing protein [Pirellulales bacterium]|nr:DUF481 domain-containing protein [Pirellulales bacterium]